NSYQGCRSTVQCHRWRAHCGCQHLQAFEHDTEDRRIWHKNGCATAAQLLGKLYEKEIDMLRLLPGGPRASIASCVVVAVALSIVVLLFAPQRLRAQPPQTITTATVDDRGVVSIGTAVT